MSSILLSPDEDVAEKSPASGKESGECSPSPVPEEDSIEIIEDDENFNRNFSKRSRKFLGKGPVDSPSISVADLITLDEDDSGSEVIQVIEDDSLAVEEAQSVFVLDTSGAAIEEADVALEASADYGSIDVETPKNEKSRRPKDKGLDMSMVLTFAGTPESSTKRPENLRRMMTCFNCNGNHTLDQCDIPHDARRIAKNKSAHFNNKRQSTARFTDEPQTSNFAPGEITKELRQALGIRPNDIPEWIYRMRKLGFVNGYPPAYLKQAVEGGATNTLEFFTDDAAFDKGPDSGRNLQPHINADKLFKYAGFNFYSNRLNDREKGQFRVPSFNDFVNLHQTALADRLDEDKKEKQKSPNKRKRHEREKNESKKARKDDLEVTICIDEDSDRAELKPSCSTSCLTPRRGNEMLSEENGRCETPTSSRSSTVPRTQSSPALLLGTSTSQTCGTPQGSTSSTSGSKPDLSKFQEGIVPFEAREDHNLKRGFFKKLMHLIKKEH